MQDKQAAVASAEARLELEVGIDGGESLWVVRPDRNGASGKPAQHWRYEAIALVGHKPQTVRSQCPMGLPLEPQLSIGQIALKQPVGLLLRNNCSQA